MEKSINCYELLFLIAKVWYENFSFYKKYFYVFITGKIFKFVISGEFLKITFLTLENF